MEEQVEARGHAQWEARQQHQDQRDLQDPAIGEKMVRVNTPRADQRDVHSDWNREFPLNPSRREADF